MRQYQVPQFITVEDKVIGPFTIKQFLYIGSGILLIVGARWLLAGFLFYPFALIVAAAAASLAFVKINELPLPIVARHAISYFIHPRLYIWKQESRKGAKMDETSSPDKQIKTIPRMSESKLSDLAWSLDIKEKVKE